MILRTSIIGDISLAKYRDSLDTQVCVREASIDFALEEGGTLLAEFIQHLLQKKKVLRRMEAFGQEEIRITSHLKRLKEGQTPTYPGVSWKCPIKTNHKDTCYWATASDHPTGVSHIELLQNVRGPYEKEAFNWSQKVLKEYVDLLDIDTIFLPDGAIIESFNQTPLRSRPAFRPGFWYLFSWHYSVEVPKNIIVDPIRKLKKI